VASKTYIEKALASIPTYQWLLDIRDRRTRQALEEIVKNTEKERNAIPRKIDNYYSTKGEKIGPGGNDKGKKIVVTNKREARRLSNGKINATGIKSGFILPSDTALSESLHVLQRTIDNGGRREESSLVMKNGKVIRGETGPPPEEGIATVWLPDIPDGQTEADVEVTIHSHPTEIDWDKEKNKVKGHPATVPGPNDFDVFSKFQMNIIVGPLELPIPVAKKLTEKEPRPPIRSSNGVVFYDNSSKKPLLDLPEGVVRKILGK
jgi:hypothetical protein